MDMQERWHQIEAAMQDEASKPPIPGGHEPVYGRSETAPSAEVDKMTTAEMGSASETAPKGHVYVESAGETDVQEVSGYYTEMEPIATPDVGEIVHGADDRVQVGNTTAYPFRTICHLEMIAPNGKNYIGSGAFIGPRVVLTAGHCVYFHADGGWARQIRVIPGRNGSLMPYGDAVATQYISVKGWVTNKDRDYDYAVIILPNNKKLGNSVGWMGLGNLAFFSLMGLNVNNSGYPGDKSYGTQWWNSNNILAVSGRRLYYRIDTMGGQSGSPVWRFKDGLRHIVGIHTTGGSPFNGATRINDDVFDNLVKWKDQ
jgi:V8-like Glu-specific endopeptidase